MKTAKPCLQKLLCLLLLWPAFAEAQPKITEGKLHYQISYLDLPAELRKNEQQLPHDATFYFKNEKSRIEMSEGVFGKNVTISDKKNKETIVLLNIQGKKFALRKSDSEMVEVRQSMQTDTAKTVTTIELVNETKKIAGYVCQKAIITKTKKGIATKSECWYTKDLPPYNTEGDEAFKQIDGFLMQYTIKEASMNMTMTVKMVMALPIEDSYFEIPEGYKLVSEKQLTAILNLMQQER